MASFKDELQAHLTAAKAYAKLSYAKRLKVGAILVKDGRIISVGRNGVPSGWVNECEDENGNTLPEVVHAEANTILFAAKNGIPTNGCDLVTTHSPCFECCKLLVQSGVKAVYYDNEYRDTTGLIFLQLCGVKVKKIGGKDEGSTGETS